MFLKESPDTIYKVFGEYKFISNYYEEEFVADHVLKFRDIQKSYQRLALTADYLAQYNSCSIFQEQRKNNRLSIAISRVIYEFFGNSYKFGKEIGSDIRISHSIASQFLRIEVQNLTTKEIFDECAQFFQKLYTLPSMEDQYNNLLAIRSKHPNRMTRGFGLLSLLFEIPIRLGVAQITDGKTYQVNARAFINLETFTNI